MMKLSIENSLYCQLLAQTRLIVKKTVHVINDVVDLVCF